MVVPHYAYPDSQVLRVLYDVGNPCVNVCYSCLTLRLHVDYCDIRFLYSSLPCLRVWLSCIWFFSYWDDNRFYWCEHMGEPLAVVMIGMLQLDGLDEYWAHFGAHRWRIYLLCFLVCTRLITISSLVFYVLGRVGPLLCLWLCKGTEYFISPNLRTLWILCTWHFY